MTVKIIQSRYVRFLLYGIYRNVYNYSLYGKLAPRFEELIWINPKSDELYYGKRGYRYKIKHSGKILYSMPFTDNNDLIIKSSKMDICVKHWVEGKSWEESGAYDWIIRALKEKKRLMAFQKPKKLLQDTKF